MTKTEPRQSCRQRPKQLKQRGSKQTGGITGPVSQTQQCQTSNTPLLKTKTVMIWDFSAHRKSRLSAPQLQAQLSRLTDGTRLMRLKSTLLSEGAWQQVTRIEDLCHTHVSHKWLHHLDACAGSVLTPHDCATIVQKRLGNRAWKGLGECRLCGSFLDPQLEHGETLQHGRSHARTLRVRPRRGVRIETRRPRHHHGGLTAPQCRPADISTTAPAPRTQRRPGCVCVASSQCSSCSRRRSAGGV